MDLNTNLPKIACFCLFLGLPKLFTPTSQFFYTDISVISVTFCNSVIIITMAYPHIPTRQILRMTLMLKSGCWDSMYFSKVNKCLVFVEYRQSLETTKKMDNPGDETDLREFCFYIYDLNGDGYISRQHHLYLWPSWSPSPWTGRRCWPWWREVSSFKWKRTGWRRGMTASKTWS